MAPCGTTVRMGWVTPGLALTIARAAVIVKVSTAAAVSPSSRRLVSTALANDRYRDMAGSVFVMFSDD